MKTLDNGYNAPFYPNVTEHAVKFMNMQHAPIDALWGSYRWVLDFAIIQLGEEKWLQSMDCDCSKSIESLEKYIAWCAEIGVKSTKEAKNDR